MTTKQPYRLRCAPLYVALAGTAAAYVSCGKSGNAEWQERHAETLERLAREYLPSGSGFDSGTEIDPDKCSGDLLRFAASFHHMNEHGSYDGWTDHLVTVRPSMVHGFTVSVSGRDRNGIKDYIAETFDAALRRVVSY